ncbi:hypothetical protein SDC9_24703 [bioreactor metagenome]|uniref:Uncharacterized protein n=2 Tax=root TaxID=1 RepID=A0A644UJ52_9ZZZZ
MNKWIINCNSYLEHDELNSKLINQVKEAKCNNRDLLLTYTINHELAGILLLSIYEILLNEENYTLQEKKVINQEIDLPYSIFYKTEQLFNITSLSDKEIEFILGKDTVSLESQKDIKEQFIEYIKTDWPAGVKKLDKRIEYLDKLFPKEINKKDPQSIFEIYDLVKLNELSKELGSGGKYYDWDRNGKYVGEVLQTLNQYIKFLEKIKNVGFDESSSQQEKDNNSKNLEIDFFESFIKRIEHNDAVQMEKKWDNIKFIIGQPNTGKSYNFEESRLFDLTQKDHYKYIKIPVSGGIGNEYKGLQNTDLAITYDPIKKEVRFGEFLQVLMSAIVNPKVPHVVFLDDFHNQDISSLLSEYTPLFKSQQKVEIKTLPNDDIFKRNFKNTAVFIKTWNSFIENQCSKDINDNEVSIVPITNRISGDSLKLIYPNNFYLLGAANFNENTLNIFADWEDRANISFKDPIETFFLQLNLKESKLELSENFKNIDKYKKISDELGPNTQEFIKCCIELNKTLHQILKDKLIFDTEKYCFGMWKIIDSNGNAISDLGEQKKVVKFLFGMIKNALRFNNKNSWINKIGWELFVAMQTNEWFKNNIKMLNGNIENIDYGILHEFNIYEDEI